MNFLDTFDIARSASPNPEQTAEQPSLNEEVNQVIGQLGRFWGGFRKQSQTALEAARKDFSEVVVQAQKELSKFTADAAQETNEAGERTEGQNNDAGRSTSSEETATPTASTSEGSEPSAEPSWSTQTLFSRLQSALPPNIISTVQNNIPESLKHASENIDLQQMRTNLLSELQRVQGVTLAQAEEYAHKSEALLREAVKEAGEVLRDAVKVLPPDEAGSSAGGSGLIWDGTDMWMLPYDPSDSTSTGKEKEGGSSSRLSETRSAVATRAEALLRRLKTDPTILKHNPEVEEGVKDQYTKWRESEVDKLEGGVDSAEWKARIDTALKDVDGQALRQLEELLVSTENEDDFSWEDEEEELAPTAANKSTQPANSSTSSEKKIVKESLAASSVELSAAGTTTPRVSSEDSFDLVSSANVSVVGDSEKTPKRKDDEEDADSDWE
ncbi:hypothetical protein M413DRAFT_446403 [Hebeloma cylindrosporum]|uniref:BSD domain-containing protein n=1 Tax=Hebeloma cylindrosporum TaxID=76867 RepID=A0A0C2YGK9_HEBCY|nr:hypothetical protein M413DRAFT_446403 [Hebeloma cylindrosporum h7]